MKQDFKIIWGIGVQKDDMQDIYGAVMEEDVIVFAFPAYFYTWNAQTKMIADRFYAKESMLKDKAFYACFLRGAIGGLCAADDYGFSEICRMFSDRGETR